MNILNYLEWLAKYGFIDIFFGLGVISFIGALINKVLPSNYDNLVVEPHPGGAVQIPNHAVANSFQINIHNMGNVNLYIARAYLKAKQRQWWTLWIWNRPTALQVHPASARVLGKDDAFELKFPGNQQMYFTDIETLVRPNNVAHQNTWLALNAPVNQELINKKKCGTLYIEYATVKKQGVHKIRV